MTSVILPSELNMSDVTFGDIKTMNTNGGKIVYLNYNGGNLNLQTPELRLPFDVSEFKDCEGKGNDKYTMTCALDKYDTDKSMKVFCEKLVEMDNKVKAYAKENSVAFFKKAKISDETIDELYNPIVKFSKDAETGEPNGKWPPNIKVKVAKRDGKFQCKMYDSKKTPFDINGETDSPSNITQLLAKDTRCKMLIQCSGVWIINGKFGCTWKVVQSRLNVAIKDLEDYAFRETEDDVQFVSSDDEEEESDDDDDDSDDSDEEVKEPAKKVRKAKTSK